MATLRSSTPPRCCSIAPRHEGALRPTTWSSSSPTARRTQVVVGTGAVCSGRISDLQDRGWTFVFLGANQDSYAEGGALGFASGSTSNFAATAPSVAAAYAGLNRATREWRGKSAQLRMLDKERFWGDRKEAEEAD